jgi:hypothetical protein
VTPPLLPLGDRVEDHPTVDVNALARAGFLEPGRRTWRGEDDEWEPFGLTVVTRGDLVDVKAGRNRTPVAPVEIEPALLAESPDLPEEWSRVRSGSRLPFGSAHGFVAVTML